MATRRGAGSVEWPPGSVRRAHEPRRTSRVWGPAWPIGLALLAIGVGLLVARDLQAGDFGSMAWAFWLVWGGCLALVSRGHPAKALSAGGMYLLVFGLFHGGLLLNVALLGDEGVVLPFSRRFIYGPGVPPAVRMCIVGCLAFTVGVLVSRTLVDRRARTSPGPSAARAPGRIAGRIGAMGLAAQVLGLLALALVIATRGGLALFSAGYVSFTAAAQNSGALTYGLLLIGLGTAFAVSGTGRQRRFGLALFALYAMIGFPLGLRGEILFTFATLVVLEVRRGRRISLRTAVLVSLAVLTLIGVVRESRESGVTGVFQTSTLASPLDGVAEMGFSIYPSVVVHSWHEDGEEYRGGDTLIAVPLRFAESFIAPPDPAAGPDDRLFNVEILERAGPVGGSPVAEGYHNFGWVGIVGLLTAIGLLIGALDGRPPTPMSNAVAAVILIPLLTNIRNFFAAVPVEIGIGFVLLAIAVWLPAPMVARSRRERRAG